MYSLDVAGLPLIVLNNFASAADLLDRRSSLYNDRPRFIVAGEIHGGGMNVSLTRYGELWRKMRRAAAECFSFRSSQRYQPLQENEAAILVSNLVKDPTNWETYVRRTAASTVLSITYGWAPLVDTSKDALVDRINGFVPRVARACKPGAHFVEVFPWMLRLPMWLTPWRSEMLDWHRKDSELFEGLLREVEEKMSVGERESSLSASLIRTEGKYGMSRRESSWLAGAVFAAGAETTVAALFVFLLAMVLHPEVMHKAQAEIDSVIGRERLPGFADKERLPYVSAIVKEILRWRPVAPLAMPHRCTQDDWYNGHFIPEGAIVLTNVWAMNHDPAVFPEPDEFRPERHLDESGNPKEIPDTHGEGHLSYGTGRRICAGKDLANQSLFIDIVTILWAADVKPVVGADGKPILPDPEALVDDGIVVRPRPFQCSIVGRSPEVLGHFQAVLNK